ncbi:MAG: metallophosphoesterase [Nanoarchaeota archaeon]|nr:metallophosphoesterase [Nanoarchaeota archaeon]MBU0978128.1 metallophosphoesterase [Nanoarchaeota archaeon]
MKILAIGDPHGDLSKIKKIPKKNADLILLTGDLGKADLARKIFFENLKRKQQGLPQMEETKKQTKAVHMEIHISTISILRYLSKFAKVYTIQGNVGIPTKTQVKEDYKKHKIKMPFTREMVNKMRNVKLIKNRSKVFGNLKIGFLEMFTDVSWVRGFKPMGYRKKMKKAKKETEKAKRILKRFGNVDILVSHQPPYGYLDKVSGKYGAPKNWWGKHAGSKILLKAIKKYQPKYVFCGHIHEGEGHAKIGKTDVYNLGVAGHVIINL